MGSNDHMDEEDVDLDIAEYIDVYSKHGVSALIETVILSADGVAFKQLFRHGDRWDVSKEDLAEYAGAALRFMGPDQYLTRDEWRELFQLADYREDDKFADRPSEPLRLWRGSPPAQRGNWSWTELRDYALFYASGFMFKPEVGLVWRAVVAPERLLGKLTWLDHSEYIVDTEGLDIQPDGLWCRCSVDLEPFRHAEAQVALDLHELVNCPRQ